jgi:hypothetical protein
MRGHCFAVAACLLSLVSNLDPLRAEDAARSSICLMLESAARAHDLPLEFFARVIWQESRFRAGAVGPRTGSGARAQGIAQFMPSTAAERQLLDPFDPVQALPKAAEFLRDLRIEFGNLGLAAAAYNAGPRRVRDWLNGAGAMPLETRSYVLAITGHSVGDWAGMKDEHGYTRRFNCKEMIELLGKEPSRFTASLEQHVRKSAARSWGVQLAAGFSRDNALAAYARTVKQLIRVLHNRDPIISHKILRSRGSRPLYQIRVGADTRAEADALCNRIRANGGACMVLRQ